MCSRKTKSRRIFCNKEEEIGKRKGNPQREKNVWNEEIRYPFWG